ncbi:MAG: cell division protein FtsA [Candidatus Tokpelaia sp. JSC085]|nr:MAG: cell division protein FtsA [Candidatus Tokpelaia sp. JSC085]
MTGGGSQLAGLPDVARRVLGGRLRIGRPLGISGLPDMARVSAFYATVGLLIYPQSLDGDWRLQSVPMERQVRASRCFSRVGCVKVFEAFYSWFHPGLRRRIGKDKKYDNQSAKARYYRA